MFRKTSNLRLILVLVILALIYVAIRLLRHTGRSSSFRSELVQIDTSRVTKIAVEKKKTQFEIFKDGTGSWKVTLPKLNKTVEATSSSVKSSLSGLLTIQPSRVVTRDPKKWADYQVDTAGTRIRVYEGSKNTLDIVIGKFGMQGRQEFFTYVKLYDDNTVYTADNFMGITYFSDPESFRNGQFLEANTDSVKQVSFTYPADSSFTLSKPDSVWNLGNQKADSLSVVNFLSELRYISTRKFVDDIEPAAFIQPIYGLTIDYKGLKTTKVQAYMNPKYGLVIHSDSNPNNYFADSTVVKRIFKGMKQFENKKTAPTLKSVSKVKPKTKISR